MSKQESKDKTRIVILVFRIKINSNSFMASLSSEKIAKIIVVTITVLSQKSLTLEKAQLFIGYLFYYARW